MAVQTLDTSDKLEKLWGHIGHMTPEQARAHIVRIRADRRVSKVRTTVKKAAKAQSDTALTKAKKLLAGADEATLRRLLESIDDNDNGSG